MSRAHVLESVKLPPRSAHSRLCVQARSRSGRRYLFVFREVQRFGADEWTIEKGLSLDLDETEPLIEALGQAMATAARRFGGPQ